jgi:hypothetical protein
MMKVSHHDIGSCPAKKPQIPRHAGAGAMTIYFEGERENGGGQEVFPGVRRRVGAIQ